MQYSLKKNFKAKDKSTKTIRIKKAKTAKTTIKDLKLKKTYYVRIRAYKVKNGKTYYSAWSKAKKIKIKVKAK